MENPDERVTALIAATVCIAKLQLPLIDPQTQLFKRRCLDELFNHQQCWVDRGGESATLMLLEVLPNGGHTAAEIIVEAAFTLRSAFRGSDYLVRNSTDQFLVVLLDTDELQAQIALNRLIDKVDRWNFTNKNWEMALRLVLSTCPPGGNLWEKLSKIEQRMQNISDSRGRTPAQLSWLAVL